MAPRSTWKGTIQLSLVSVPVKAYTGLDSSTDIRLNQIHRESKQRIRYQKVVDDGPVSSEEIVSGYEYAKGSYVLVDPKEVAALRKQSDKAIRIHGFTTHEAIDDRYQAGKTYYLLPDGIAGGKPYELMRRAMADTGVVAICQMILAGRENLIMLRPLENLLVAETLHYAEKLKPLADFTSQYESPDVSEDELALTHTLISASTIENVDMRTYKDQYRNQLEALIQKKLDGEDIVQVTEHEEPKILNLMEALKQSVEAARTGERKTAMSAKKTGTSKAATAKKAAASAKKTTKKKTAKKASKKKSG